MNGGLLTILLLALGGVGFWRWFAYDKSHRLVTSYRQDQRLFRSGWSKGGLILAFFVFVSAPIGFSWIGFKGAHVPGNFMPGLPLGEYPLTVLNFAGLFAIGAIALNLLIGYTGQVSLGHAAFLALGAYTAAWLAVDQPIGHLPSIIWVLLVALLGAAISALVGPFALRLRGQYLAVVSIGLVFLGEHFWVNAESVTGGIVGRSDLPPFTLAVWPGKVLNFSVRETGESDFFGFLFRRNQGYFWLIWAFVALSVVAAKNLVRTRQGRAMQSVRDRDLSAEVIGVNLARTKTMAFAVSGALAALSGALYGSYLQSVTPEFFNLGLSIQYVAMIIVGGVGTVFGAVVGAVSVGSIERLIDRFRWLFQWIPFLNLSPSGRGITLQNFVRMVFGGFIISFLMFFPLGIAGLWQRVKRYFQTWPFS